MTRRMRRYGPVVVSGRWNLGVCPICETKAVFVELGPHLRRDYQCLRCRSVPRQRALVSVLCDVAPDWRELSIFEAGPSGPSSSKLQRECPGYFDSQFMPGWDRGEIRDGVRCEDLEHLTLDSASVEVVVTQDVFEHVLRPDLAFAEVSRVLVPGGVHVFSVPMYQRRDTIIRALPLPDGGIDHVREPKFHKGPADPGGTLVAREWGLDIGDFIASAMTTTIHQIEDRRRGIAGNQREILVSRKPHH